MFLTVREARFVQEAQPYVSDGEHSCCLTACTTCREDIHAGLGVEAGWPEQGDDALQPRRYATGRLAEDQAIAETTAHDAGLAAGT